MLLSRKIKEKKHANISFWHNLYSRKFPAMKLWYSPSLDCVHIQLQIAKLCELGYAVLTYTEVVQDSRRSVQGYMHEV